MANKQAIADLIRDLELRSAGIRNHLPQLASIGVTITEADACQNLADLLSQLDNEQEALKAALASKTAQIEAAKKDGRDLRTRVTKRIKAALETNPEKWQEFGITARK